jgi:signal peptidase II
MGLVAVVGITVIVLDQITKIWAASSLVDRNIDLFWTARFNLTRNFGSAFGLGSGLGRWLGVLVLFVIAGVLWYARTISDRRMLALFGAIAGGAIGNLIDRIFRADDGFMSGGVIDFIDFQWWPIFNVADIAVVCGATGLMWLSLREPA